MIYLSGIAYMFIGLVLNFIIDDKEESTVWLNVLFVITAWPLIIFILMVGLLAEYLNNKIK